MHVDPNARYRAWAFTWLNYPEDAVEQLKSLEAKASRVYAGFETAPTTGTPHLQGHVRLYNPVKLSFFVKRFPGIHVEPKRCADATNTLYCAKEGRVAIDLGKDADPEAVEQSSRKPRDELALLVMDAIDSG